MNSALFEDLIAEAIREITERHPAYFSQFALNAPPPEKLAEEYGEQPLFAAHSRRDLMQALAFGFKYLELHGAPLRQENVTPDLISQLLIQSIFDAYLAARGDIALKPPQRERFFTADVLFDRYTLGKTRNDVCYALTKGAQRTLLIVSSTGIPLVVWLRLLRDNSINRRYLIVQSRGSPLFEGGTPLKSRLPDDVADIKEVILSENLFDIDVLAWCNGSRVAIELCQSLSERVASLMLVAPTFHGAVPADEYPSPFEDSLPKIHKILNQDPNRGRYFLQCLNQVALPADLATLKDNPEKRVNTILQLPPHAIARELVLPLSTVEYFQNYVDRILGDETYDIRTAISRIRCPILLLTGTHDAAISTRAARDVLMQCGRDVLHVTILGAGHHIHVLQFAYFRYVLDSFLARAPPARTLRLVVDRLAG